MLELRVIKGEKLKGHKFALSPQTSMIVGREKSCDIFIPSRGISKKHCRLTPLPGGRLEIEDLQSSNGTFVNGVLVKKHIVNVGDLINLHDFTLQLSIRAPELVSPSSNNSENFFSGGSSDNASIPSYTPPNQQNAVARWLDQNVFPLADSLAEKFDLRFLIVFFFITWSALIIGLTAAPFREKANERVTAQASEVAKLYARQLVRVNQQAIVDQRFRDLVAELDSRPGQTPGLLNAMILDSTSSQILAPAEYFGQGLPNAIAAEAVNQDKEHLQVDEQGIIYASAPIKIGSTDGNKTVATAFVVFNPTGKNFSIPALFEQIVDSLLKALLISILFLSFVYRWIEGSILVVAQKVDTAMKKSETTISSSFRWPALQILCEQISAALGRSNSQSHSMSQPSSESWAAAATSNTQSAAAAFDTSLKVIAWNSEMERVIGIRASIAVGSDIAGASRDVAFESLVRDLSQSASVMPWSSQQKIIEFSGRRYMAGLVFGKGFYLLNLSAVED